jgi:hypothetical protein
MKVRPYRSASVAAALSAVCFVIAPHAHAEDTPAPTPPPAQVRATMACERAAEAGRVRCSAEVRTEGGRTIAWSDLTLLQLPDFVSALKGRVGQADATARDASSTKWAFGLVARRAGQGEARARIRVVVCEGGTGPQRCAPFTTEVRAMINVGG